MTSFRVAVVMSAVHVKPGRTSGIGSSSDHDHLEVGRLRRRRAAVPAGLDRAVADLGDVPLERPVRQRVDGDLRQLAELTFGMLVSSTSTSAWITDMSASVSSTVPALFIVPMTAVSPSWMLRRVTMPSIGDSMRTLLEIVPGALERRRAPA